MIKPTHAVPSPEDRTIFRVQGEDLASCQAAHASGETIEVDLVDTVGTFRIVSAQHVGDFGFFEVEKVERQAVAPAAVQPRDMRLVEPPSDDVTNPKRRRKSEQE